MNRERLIKDLIYDEGLRLKPYKCPSGKWTIGVGRNFEDNPFDKEERNMLDIEYDVTSSDEIAKVLTRVPISEEEAIWLLNRDIDKFWKQLTEKLPWVLNAPEEVQEVLLNMAFNMGIGSPPVDNKKGRGLLSFGNTLELIRTGQYEEAAKNMRSSYWAVQVGMRAIRLSDRIRQL